MIIRLKTWDSSLDFLREGYTFISSRCDRLGTDAFRTRLGFRPVVCLRGADAARIFYEDGRFTRAGALPASVLHLLQDEGSVQSLDGTAHFHRMELFLDLLRPGRVEALCAIFARRFAEALERGTGCRMVLHQQLCRVLTLAACEWAGIGIDARAARLRRRRCEHWAAGVISRIRAGSQRPDSVAGRIAAYRDPSGAQLVAAVAAVELINILRPIVAVGPFIVFAAAALEEHPRFKAEFAAGRGGLLEPFAQEVRRYYPFFPLVAGRALVPFDWHGHRFRPGELVMLDQYGTNHDRWLWVHPEAFRPERFLDAPPERNSLVPQGGGFADAGHRCPGERATVELIKTAVRQLSGSPYDVPAQDLGIDLARMPALPRSGFIMAPAATQPGTTRQEEL
jgi:fatty-acid peroxygenase